MAFWPIVVRADAPATQPSPDPSAVVISTTQSSPADPVDPADPEARALLEELRDVEARTGRRHIGYDADGKIVSITLDRWITSDVNIRALALFPDLTRVQIGGWNGSLSPEALGDLAKLKHLDRLELRRFGSELTIDYAMAIGRMTSLHSLSIMGSDIHSPAISFLVGLRNLKSLELRSCDDLTDADFGALAQLSNIEELDLTYSGVSDKNLDSLAQLPKLKWLWVPGTRVTIEGVQNSRLYGKVTVRGAKNRPVEKVKVS
jgi:hypothetical protein